MNSTTRLLVFRALLAVGLCFGGANPTHAATLKVGKTGSTPYSTIGAAVVAAKAGDTIEIGPGTYEEQVSVTKDLNLVGAGPQQVSIRPAADRAVWVGNSVSVRLFGLTLTSRDSHAVEVGRLSSLRMDNCVVAGAYGYGVAHYTGSQDLSGLGSTLVMDQCTVVGCGLMGVYWDCYAAITGFVSIRNCIFSLNARRSGNHEVVLAAAVDVNGPNLIQGKETLINSGGNLPSGWLRGDPRFVSAESFNFLLRDGSDARDKGLRTLGNQDPDGTLPDLGAYGGSLAATFWPYPAGGPLIKEVSVPQAAVPQGGKITIRATATTR